MVLFRAGQFDLRLSDVRDFAVRVPCHGRTSFGRAGSSSRCLPSWSLRWSCDRRVFFRSRPGNLLLASTIAVIVVTPPTALSPLNSLLGFVPLPGVLMLVLIGLTVLYVFVAELAKKYFYARMVNARFLGLGEGFDGRLVPSHRRSIATS